MIAHGGRVNVTRQCASGSIQVSILDTAAAAECARVRRDARELLEGWNRETVGWGGADRSTPDVVFFCCFFVVVKFIELS